MTAKRSIGEQISAVQKAAQFMSGAARASSLPERERDYLVECVNRALETLIWVRDREEQIREAVHELTKPKGGEG